MALTKTNIKTYSIPIASFSRQGFARLVRDYGIDLGAHESEEVYKTSLVWPWLEWDRERSMWGVGCEASMETLPARYVN